MDGEDYDLEDDVIDTHIAHCDKCKAFQERAAKLSFSLTPHTPLEPSQELAEDILAQVEPEWRRVSGGRLASLAGARVALVVLAIVFVIWAITLIVASGPFTGVAEGGAMLNPDSNPVEAEHLIESAALRLGLAAGMIFRAWRPSSRCRPFTSRGHGLFLPRWIRHARYCLKHVEQQSGLYLVRLGRCPGCPGVDVACRSRLFPAAYVEEPIRRSLLTAALLMRSSA